MKRENRVFFVSEREAIREGFRPCGKCMPEEYGKWRMKLFSNGDIENLLPSDGTAKYYSAVLSAEETQSYFDRLEKGVEWRPDEVIIAGKRTITKRLVAWYGDEPFEYTYSGSTKKALTWTDLLLELRNRAELLLGEKFNSCLLNLYHDGSEGVGWHSDNEDCFVKHATIASLSLGAERKFMLKHRKTKETISIPLENGSLLAMKGKTQTYWIHSLPKSVNVTEPRINLTFRRMQGCLTSCHIYG